MGFSSTRRRSSLHRQGRAGEIVEDNLTGLQELGGTRWRGIRIRLDILPPRFSLCINNVALPGDVPVLVVRHKWRAGLSNRYIQDEIDRFGEGQQRIMGQIEAVLYRSVPRDDRDAFSVAVLARKDRSVYASF